MMRGSEIKLESISAIQMLEIDYTHGYLHADDQEALSYLGRR
jgi:hypothetical protein